MAKKVKQPKQEIKGLSPCGVHLEGKTVILRQSWFGPVLTAEDHPFYCGGGFGCNPQAMGTKVFGHFVKDGEHCFVRRGDVAYILDEAAVAAITSAKGA